MSAVTAKEALYNSLLKKFYDKKLGEDIEEQNKALKEKLKELEEDLKDIAEEVLDDADAGFENFIEWITSRDPVSKYPYRGIEMVLFHLFPYRMI